MWSRYSIVGARAAATLTEHNGQALWIGTPPVGVPTDGDPTVALRETVAILGTERVDGLPPLTGGMVGAISYDAVRRWEHVPDTGRDDLGLPELAMVLATDLAVLDHADGSVLLVANAVNYDATDARLEWAYADAVERLDRMAADLAAPAPSTVAVVQPVHLPVTSSHTQDAFHDIVERCKEAIRAGDAFQIVVSQRFTLACPADTRPPASGFAGLHNHNLSYFVGLDADETRPQMLLAGDRNITNNLAPVRSVLMLPPESPAGWTAAIHIGQGNVGLSDGSVQQFSTPRLRDMLKNTGDPTNRIALPD